MTNVNTFQGTVGIGTNAAQDKLHVNGSLLIQHDTTYDTGGTAGWYKIGVWDPTGITGARLKIRFLGVEGYSSQTGARGGETILYASCNNNSPSTVANMSGRIHAYGTPAITEVKFVHLDSSRHKFEIRAYVKTYVKMSMSVECNQTDSFAKFFTASSDPGDDSATVGSALFSHVFDNSGNVGIGTGGPQDIAHIYKDGGNDPHGLLIENKNSGTGQATLKFGVAAASGEGTGLAKAGIFFKRSGTNGRGDLIFCMDNANDTNDVDTGNHALTIYRDGKVGIGILTPSTKLHIGSGDVGIDRDQKFDFGAGYGANWYIKQKSADNKIYFERTGGNGNELVIDTSGNVGIGTATPRNRNPGGGNPGLSIYNGRLQVGATEASYNTAVIGGGGAIARVARNNFLNVNCDFTFPRGFQIVSFGYINFHDANITNTQAINVSSGNGPYRTVLAGSLSYIQISTLSSNTLRFRGVNLPSNYNDWGLYHWFSGYVY